MENLIILGARERRRRIFKLNFLIIEFLKIYIFLKFLKQLNMEKVKRMLKLEKNGYRWRKIEFWSWTDKIPWP